jgi:hypothetical protein
MSLSPYWVSDPSQALITFGVICMMIAGGHKLYRYLLFQIVSNAFVEISGVLAVIDTMRTAETLNISPLGSILLATITCYTGSLIVYIEDKAWHGNETFTSFLRYSSACGTRREEQRGKEKRVSLLFRLECQTNLL